MFPPVVCRLIVHSLSGTPDVLEALIGDLTPGDPRWDHRPESDRFTLREMLAHLADMEPVFLERFMRIRDEEEPELPDVDENTLAIENDYAHSDPRASLEWFRGGRLKTVQVLGDLASETWQRFGHKPPLGAISIETLAALVVAHDGYHTQQAAQWLTRPALEG